jgi:hypothetical protein
VIVISAAGVGLAIVLLVTGVITSNLLFVYISIGVSVAAALLLAVGVFMRRELFMGRQAPGKGQPRETAKATVAQTAPAAEEAPAARTTPAARNVMAGAGVRPPGPRPRRTAAFTAPESEIVFVTPGRRRFHAPGCGLLVGRFTEELTRGEALEEGFSACTTCLPGKGAAAEEGRRAAGPVRTGPAVPARTGQAHPGPVGEETVTARQERAREETVKKEQQDTKRAKPEPFPVGSAGRPRPDLADDRGASATGTPTTAAKPSGSAPPDARPESAAGPSGAGPAATGEDAAGLVGTEATAGGEDGAQAGGRPPGVRAAEPQRAEPQRAEPDSAEAQRAEPESPEPVQEHGEPTDSDGEFIDDGDPDSTVWVVRGVSRYHLSDCVLVQVVDEEDVDTMTLAEARTGGCSPCRACHTD